jgi:hypothetical protein
MLTSMFCKKLRSSFTVCLESRPISLIRGETIEYDQSPSDVVRAFVWQEVAEQMASALGNDGCPARGVLSERVTLKRIDFIANEASERHDVLPYEWRRCYRRLRRKWFD